MVGSIELCVLVLVGVLVERALLVFRYQCFDLLSEFHDFRLARGSLFFHTARIEHVAKHLQ